MLEAKRRDVSRYCCLCLEVVRSVVWLGRVRFPCRGKVRGSAGPEVD